MSFDGKSKENQVRYCSQCFGEKTVEHVCSSQSFSDSLYTLSELANEQLTQLDQFALTHVHLKCQEDLEAWHSAAVNHLGEIFQQRLVDLERIFKDEIRPNLQTYRLKMIEQLKTKIIPRMNRILDEQLHEDKQIERIQTFVHNIRSECDALRDGQWIHIQLPDIKNFSVPIRIAKMALAARLTDGEKDPLEKLSEDEEEENAKKKRKEKKINAIDPLEIFATNRDPFKAFPLETNSSTLALSNQFILVHDQKKLLLFDFNKQIQQFDWNDNDYGILVDICWMSSLSVFVILTIHSVYLYDPLKRSSSNLPTKVDSIKPLDRSHVLASLCPFDRDLYINYHKGVHIDQYRVSDTSEWSLHKRYSKGECSENKDVGIRDVRCDHQHLCLSIMQHDDYKWRLDLISRDMVRVRRGVPMDAGENQHKFFSMLIPLQDQRWLFVNWFTNKLWMVDQQGKTRLVKESQIKNIRNTSVSPDMSMLAVRTEKPAMLKIYKLD